MSEEPRGRIHGQIPNGVLAREGIFRNRGIFKAMKKLTSALLAVSLFLGGCASHDSDMPLMLLKSKLFDDNKAGILQLYKMGKNAIPLLIDAIADPTRTQLILVNPTVSNREGEDLSPYFGVLACYLIEWIQATEYINESDFINSPFLFGDPPDSYIYEYGRIMVDGRNISKDDLSQLKAIYRTWWQNNRRKKLEELRRDWKMKKRPLNDTRYYWR
jgi:hypothetical protein